MSMPNNLSALSWLILLGLSAGLHAQSLPGLPIAPVAQPETTTFTTTTSDSPSNELSLEELDRLVAAERQRLASLEPAAAAPQPAIPRPDLPPPTLDVSLGKTVSMGLGLQQVSRIQAPFTALRIQHQSTASIKKQGSVVYVSPADRTPFVIYLEDRNDPNRSVGLLLRPHADLPPVQVRLHIPGDAPPERVPVSAEPSGAQQNRIRSVLRGIVLGAAPAGFNQAPITAHDPVITCRIPGLSIAPELAWHGTDLTVLKAQIKNTSAGVISLNESLCARDDVVAVAAYPDTELWPEASTDLLIVYRNGQQDLRKHDLAEATRDD